MSPDQSNVPSDSGFTPPTPAVLDDVVTELLGRRPQGDYELAVARADGTPVVLLNAPFLHSGRPMPTRYWLIDPELNKAIGTLESIGGVKTAERLVDPAELQASHDRYRREREAAIASDHIGPRPTGGVGGTRTGVKCLHAHYGYFLAGAEDPVGAWVHDQLEQRGETLEDLVVLREVPNGDELPHLPPIGSDTVLVELGSGSLKTLVVRNGEEKRTRIATQLFTELSDGRGLSDEGRKVLTDALRPVADTAKTLQVQPLLVATAAQRQWQSEEVAAVVRESLGVGIQVLSGEREARLGFAAAFGAKVDTEPVDTGAVDQSKVSIDIGYGSTEIAALDTTSTAATPALNVISLPIGAGNVTTQYLHSDPPRADELSAALSVIELHLDDVRLQAPAVAQALADDTAEIIGLGVVRYIGEVELGRNQGDEINGYRMAYTDVEEVFRALATESSEDRAANPGLLPEHVDWIVGAICILVETMRQFGIEAIQVSTAGLLDGLLHEHHRDTLS